MFSTKLHASVVALPSAGKAKINDVIEAWGGHSEKSEVADYYLFRDEMTVVDSNASNSWVSTPPSFNVEVTTALIPLGEKSKHSLFAFVAPHESMTASFVEVASSVADAQSCLLVGDLNVALASFVNSYSQAERLNFGLYDPPSIRGFELAKTHLDGTAKYISCSFDAEDYGDLRELATSVVTRCNWKQTSASSVTLCIESREPQVSEQEGGVCIENERHKKFVRVFGDLSAEFELDGEGPDQVSDIIKQVFACLSSNVSVRSHRKK